MRSIVVLVLLAALAVGGNTAGTVHPATVQWTVVARADFDGDGQEDQVLGENSSHPRAYRRITVRRSAGENLLEIADEALFWEVLVAPGPLPILVVGAADGKWLGVRAFMYSPRTTQMQRLTWDGRNQVRGRKIQVDPAGSIAMWTESGRVAYQYAEGQLRQNPNPR
ncbi:MAG TPA: hypothetical protein VD969_28230 [Symbiobacteriaceae bacterium]|nr:hypothetical protein [Symbiobacteriaceae bacterium]